MPCSYKTKQNRVQNYKKKKKKGGGGESLDVNSLVKRFQYLQSIYYELNK